MNSTSAAERVPADSCLSRRCFKISIHMWFKHFSNWCFCTGVSEPACKQWSRFSTPHSSMVLLDILSSGFPGQVLWCPASPALWPWCGAQTPRSTGKSSRVFIFLPNVGCWTWVHILARLSLPLLSQCTPFTLCYGAAILLAFRSFSGGNYSTCRYRFFSFCPEEEARSRSS